MRPDALIFDVYGTCVDWRTGVRTHISQIFAVSNYDTECGAFADAWRGKYQPAMEEIRSRRRPYVDLDVLHRENLDVTLKEFGFDEQFGDREREDLNRAWERLPPWADTVPGLTRLKEQFIIAPCSNGSISLMARLSKFADLPWDCVLGAGVTRAYKPDPEAYLRSCAALRLPPERVMMVAAHNDDLAAARAVGLLTCFFPRPAEHGTGQTSDLAPSADWDIVAADMEDVAIRLVC